MDSFALNEKGNIYMAQNRYVRIFQPDRCRVRGGRILSWKHGLPGLDLRPAHNRTAVGNGIQIVDRPRDIPWINKAIIDKARCKLIQNVIVARN